MSSSGLLTRRSGPWGAGGGDLDPSPTNKLMLVETVTGVIS